jgi:DNA-binding NtrC family response regulator
MASMAGVKTILVLEDEPCVMKVLRLVLLRAGYTLIEASSAEQALQQSRKSIGNISLIIAEVTPPCSGLHVSLQMKKWMPALGIILTSCYPIDMWDEQQRAELFNAPSDVRVLGKPFHPAQLCRMVYEMIGAVTIPTATA